MDDYNQTSRENQQHLWVKRRRKPDWVLRTVTVVTLVGWVTAMVALALYYMGTPKDNSAGNAASVMNPNIGTSGVVGSSSSNLLWWTFIAVLVSCIVCILGFILNFTRKRRKTDKFNRLLIILSVVSIVFMVILLVNHAGSIF